MQTSYHKIKNKSVETKSGTKLGKVCNILIDTESDFITHYEVKTKLLSGKNLLISRDQIIKHEPDKIIVDDNIKQEDNEENEQAKNITPEPVAMRETN